MKLSKNGKSAAGTKTKPRSAWLYGKKMGKKTVGGGLVEPKVPGFSHDDMLSSDQVDNGVPIGKKKGKQTVGGGLVKPKVPGFSHGDGAPPSNDMLSSDQFDYDGVLIDLPIDDYPLSDDPGVYDFVWEEGDPLDPDFVIELEVSQLDFVPMKKKIKKKRRSAKKRVSEVTHQISGLSLDQKN